jgi:NAD(P)-dependent dehydrogenase (short-subunit alcohol dehydrogenase family)
VKTKSKSTILVTGANKGLGREATKRLVAAGHEVWAAARDPERGRAAAEEARFAWKAAVRD